MKYLIVGLGNPGREYAETRHNIGFKVLDALVDKKNSDTQEAKFKTERLGDVARVRVKNKMLTLLKPSTYMNLSGKAVAYWMQKENIPVENVLVVVDDITFNFGVLRMRKKGSDGGHNGLKDICAVLNTTNYTRVRFGVGGDFAHGAQIDYVLGEWNDDEKAAMNDALDNAIKAIESFVLMGADRAMNIVNAKPQK